MMNEKIKSIIHEDECEKFEREISGWWSGKGKVLSIIDENNFNIFFDLDLLEYDKKMIMTISKDKNPGEYIVPLDFLNSESKAQILDNIIEGATYGVVWLDGESLEWEWAPDIDLDGVNATIVDLSKYSREHIGSAMLDGYYCGEINEIAY